MINIEISKELCDKIEALQYEVESRKDLIAFIISNDMKTSSSQFERYNQEYLEFYKKYNLAKQEMVRTYFPDVNYLSWNLDFASRTVTIEEK